MNTFKPDIKNAVLRYRSGKIPLLIISTVALLFIGSSAENESSRSVKADQAKLADQTDSLNSASAKTGMIIIPLKNAGRLFMIEAVIDNEKGNLIFDTGASSLVLNTTYFRKYVKKGVPVSQGITGNVGQSYSITAGDLNVSGLHFSKIPATLADLSHIENRRGVKVLGLFGFELIRGFEVVIDLGKNELKLYRINSKGARLSPSAGFFYGDHYQKIEESRNIVFLSGSVGGKKLRFCLDTGAETNALDRHCPGSVLESVTIERKTDLSGAGAASTEVLYGMMNDFRLGDHELKSMSTVITSLDAMSEAYGLEMDGMLGYDFLIKGPVCINFVKKQFDMQLTKRSSNE